MEWKYKAFISYRHLPLDKSVAIKLHHAIEHYVIPKALRKNGEKTPGRVFRDQDELPISSDLSNDIQLALDNSEYLIVVCSKETSKSKWVLREISYFIEHHDRSHVLAILVDGTPEEAFPAELTEVYSPEGEYIKSVEPLAANIVADSRMKRNSLFRTEKLRLLAALIGCPYDSLYQREQRYKIRRITAAAAAVLMVAAGFIGILLNRNRIISENYENTLRSQSTFLASEARRLLKEGDRLSAIALAIEALPTEEKERPLVRSAERVLSESINAYVSPSEAGTNILQADGIISAEKAIMKFDIDEISGQVCTVTQNGTVTMWEAENCRQLWSYETGSDYSLMDAQFTDEGSLIVINGGELVSLRLTDGSVQWRVKHEDINNDTDSFRFTCMHLSMDRERIYAFNETALTVFSTSDGSVLSGMRLPELEINGEKISYELSKKNVCLSDDEKYISLLFSYGEDENWSFLPDREGICVMRVDSGEIVYIKDEVIYGDLGNIVLFNGNTFLYSANIPNDGREIIEYNEGETGQQTVETRELYCVNLTDGALKWKSVHSYCFASDDIMLYHILPDGTPALVFGYSNHVDIVNVDNGNIVSQAEYYSVIKRIDINDENMQIICRDGRMGYVWFDNLQNWFYIKQMKEGVVHCIKHGDIYWALDDNNNITKYTKMFPDPAWIDIDSESPEESYYGDEFICSDESFIMFNSYDNNKVICGKRTGLKNIELPVVKVTDEIGYETEKKYKLESLEGNQGIFSWTMNDEHGVLYLDIETGDITELKCDTDLKKQSIFRNVTDKEWYMVAFKQESYLDPMELHFIILDDKMNIKKEVISEDTFGFAMFDIKTVYYGRNNLYIYDKDSDRAYQVNAKEGTIKQTSEELTSAFGNCVDEFYSLEFVHFDEIGRFLVVHTDEKTIKIFNENGEYVNTITAYSSGIVSVWFSPDGKYMLTLETDAILRKYAIKDWNLLSYKDLNSRYSVSLYRKTVWQDTDKDFLCLNVDNHMYLIDKEDYEVYAYIPNCYGYMEKDDFFLCRDEMYKFSGFQRHTVESLISRGKEILNGWELSDEQKYEYGLD